MSLYAGGWFGFGPHRLAELERFVAVLPETAGTKPLRARSIPTANGVLVLPSAPTDAGGAQASVHSPATGGFLMVMGHLFDGGKSIQLKRREASVSEQLWAAWQQFGPQVWQEIDGSFVAALGNQVEHRLILVCDREENHSLYFRVTEQGCLFSTELDAILATLPEQPELNSDFFIDSLLCTWHHSDLTPAQGIHRVPPGHWADISPEGVRYHRHCHYEDFVPVRFSSDDDYVDAALEQLEAAIRRRLPPSGPVAVHCSSGLDSSLVTAVTSRLLAAQGREIVPLTQVTPQSLMWGSGHNAHWDEGPRVREFIQTLPNARPIEISLDQPDLYGQLDAFQAAIQRPAMGIANLKPLHLMHSAAAKLGCSVVLTGIGGNVTLSAGDTGRELHDLFMAGRWAHWLAGWRSFKAAGSCALGLSRLTMGPLVPDALLAVIERMRGRALYWSVATTALRPGLPSEYAGAFETWRKLAPVHRGSRKVRQRQATILGLGGWQLITQATRRQLGSHLRHPLADRQLIRFALGLPAEQTLYRGETRSLARRLARRLGIPASICDETRRAYAVSAWPKLIRENQARIAQDLQSMADDPLASKLLDIPRLRTLLENFPEGGYQRPEVLQVYLGQLFPALSAGRFIATWRGCND